MSEDAPDASTPLASRARFLVALVGASVAAAAFAVVLRLALGAASTALYGTDDVMRGFSSLSSPLRVAAPALGAFVGGLLTLVARRLPASRGVSDVMEAVVLGRGRVAFRPAFVKSCASLVSLLGGGSVGREGPLIQVGAALSGRLAGLLALSPTEVRIIYAAGTAAGFAAVYNTPIAATLFVVEVVVGVIALDVVVPVALAAAIATAISRAVLGGDPMYGTRTYALVSARELASSIVLGPLGGVVAAGFMGLLARGERLFARVKVWLPLRAALGGLIVGLLAVGFPDVTGNGAEAIREMLDGRVIGVAILVLLVAKALATTASVSSGAPGGVFTPSMFLGAALGGGLASVSLGGAGADRVPLVGAFALVGMASVVAGTTHAPLMATVLAFEMSGDYALVVPLLLATALAMATARALRPDSIYASELARRGISLDRTLAEHLPERATRPPEPPDEGG